MSTFMDLGWWQVIIQKAPHTKSSLFGENKNLTWNKICMGGQNLAPVFGEIMMVM